MSEDRKALQHEMEEWQQVLDTPGGQKLLALLQDRATQYAVSVLQRSPESISDPRVAMATSNNLAIHQELCMLLQLPQQRIEEIALALDDDTMNEEGV